jgi:hypothetical protein
MNQQIVTDCTQDVLTGLSGIALQEENAPSTMNPAFMQVIFSLNASFHT